MNTTPAGGNPTLTVVTVCRNALPLLGGTVESVLSQNVRGVEYWIVDGGSTDGTAEYLATLTPRGVRVRSEPDRGIADAMNKGVGFSAGAWIAHLHAGDAYLPGALREVLARADAPADVLCGALLKEEERGEAVAHPAPDRLPWDMTIHHPSTFARREVFEELGGFDERYPNAMDYDLFLRAFVRGKRFLVIPHPLARMAAGGQSERSLWATLSETHAIRRRHIASGATRTFPYVLTLYARGLGRRALQRAGLGRLVAWYRRRYSMARKG